MSAATGDERLVTDLLDPLAVAEPYEVYRRLREHDPVTWSPEHRAWILSTHAEVHSAFRDTRLSSDRLTPLERRLDPTRQALLGPTFALLRGWMVFHDPPDHERLREPVRRAFTPRVVERLRPRISAITESLLDDAEHAASDDPDRTVDLVRQLAFPLPAIVIAELLGVPPADRDRFKTWSAQLGAIVFGASNRPDQAEMAAAGTAQFAEYFTWLIRRYETEPADNLVSALIASRDQGDGLTTDELVGACTLLLFGGHETTTNLIGNATLALVMHPDQWAWLREHPDLIGLAIEELHRYDGPSKLMVRIVGVDHERSGHRLEAGQTVFLGIAGANRDPLVFAEPDSLQLQRSDSHRHLGFGYGLHHCIGAPLARLEAQVALAALARRRPSLTLAADTRDLRWSGVLLGRSLEQLPVTW